MRGRWLLALAIGGLVLLAGRAVAAGAADWLWFSALGAGEVWRQRCWDTAIASGGSGLIAGLFVFANLYGVRSSVTAFILPRRLANLEIGEEVPGSRLVLLAALLAAAFGWMLALPGDAWPSIALARSGLPFGEADPYFERDLAFYVNWLPFESALYMGAFVTVSLTTGLVAFCYSLTPSLRWERGRLHLSHHARRHLVTLAAILLVLVAWSFRLDQFRPLFLGSGLDGAFSFADHRAVMTSSGWLAVLALGGAGALLVFGWLNQMRMAFLSLAVLFIVGAGTRGLWPLLVRRIASPEDAVSREAPYLQLRAQYSRRAYDVERILPGDSSLGFRSPRAAALAVSAWDPALLLSAAARRARGDAIGLGWGTRNGALVADVPVRIPATAGDSDSAGWVIDRVLAAGAGPEGLPTEPPDAADSAFPVADPLVYPGAPDDLIVVADTSGSMPAPALTTRGSRLAFAWSHQRLGLIGAELPGPRPVAITVRDVRSRVERLAPFFVQGSAVTPVLLGDALYWVIDLYTASATYPFSRRDTLAESEYSYVHHAATAIVNGRTGKVSLLRDARLDPVAASWVRIFPQLFVEATELAPALVNALPPASDGARLQARMLARYGRRGEVPPDGDIAPAFIDTLPAAVREAPYALPGGRTVAWSVPLVDANEHVTGVVVAVGGANRRTYAIGLSHPGERWSTITGRLKTALDSALSPPAGTRVVRGSVRAVPVTDGLLFTQSAFARRPEVPAVVLRSAVLSGVAVTTGRGVAQALGASLAGADAAALNPAAYRARALALHAQMRAALARGDWVAFGAAFDALGALLKGVPHQP